jgi:hypothetical protein
MNEQDLQKETLLIIGVGGISAGMAALGSNMTLGLVSVGVGIVVIVLRGYLKKNNLY